MLICYHGTNCHAMAHVNSAALKQMKAGRGKTTTMIQSPQDVKWLRPGWNEFPCEVWEQNKDHPGIKKMLKKGTIELLSYKAKIKVKTKTGKIKLVDRMVGADDRPVRLRYFDEVMAVKIAKQTFDRDILQRWIDEENRHKVKKVLRKQIEPLLNTAEDEDEDDGIEEDFD